MADFQGLCLWSATPTVLQDFFQNLTLPGLKGVSGHCHWVGYPAILFAARRAKILAPATRSEIPFCTDKGPWMFE